MSHWYFRWFTPQQRNKKTPGNTAVGVAVLWARELHALEMGLQDFAMHQCLISALIVSGGEFCGFLSVFKLLCDQLTVVIHARDPDHALVP